MKKMMLSEQQQHIPKRGKTWTPSLSAREVWSSASNIVSIKSGVSPSVHFKAGNSPYKCSILFADEAMLKSIQTHTTREAIKANPEFCLLMKKLEAFIALQYVREIYGEIHSIDFLWSKVYGPVYFAKQCPVIVLLK